MRILSSLFFCFFLCLFLDSSVSATSLVLRCDSLRYDEKLKRVDAVGNVSLILNDTTISASQLSFYTDDEYVVSSENVHIKRDNESFESSSLFMDLTNQSLSLTDIKLAVRPEKTKQDVYIQLSELIDSAHVKVGKHSKISTCDLAHPHHYLHSWRLYYYPNKGVHLLGSYFRNDFSFFPFSWIPFPLPLVEILPIPYYYYQLGTRKAVLNFPVFGQKRNNPQWGWFVQNSLDYRYKNNKESTLYVDWYEAKLERKGEWGYGIRHHYGSEENSGSVYIYNYDYTLSGEEKQNLVYALDHQIRFSNSQLSGSYKRLDVDERINSRGSDNRVNKTLSFDHDLADYPFKVSVTESQDLKNGVSLLRTSTSKHFSHDTLSFSVNRNRYISNQRETLRSSMSHSKTFRPKQTLKQDVHFTQYDSTADSLSPEQSLTYKSVFSQDLDHDIKLSVRVNYFQDLDQDRVTSDSESSVNNYLYKLPEIEVSKKTTLFLDTRSTSVFRFGDYTEVRHNATYSDPSFTKKNRIEPNVYYLNQGFSKSVSELPYKSIFSISTAYEQYIFKNKDKSLFEGDAQYRVGLHSSLKSTFFKFVTLTSSYSSNYAPDENNSPFYAFRRSFSEKNQLSESLTFFYKKSATPSFNHNMSLSWTHATGYNWLRNSNPYNDYRSSLTASFDRHYLRMSMSQKLNFTPEQRLTKYTPLHIRYTHKTASKAHLDYALSYNLNDATFKKEWTVVSSKLLLKFPLGKDPDYQWQFNCYFNYKSSGIGKALSFDAYQLQTFSFTKKEHQRLLEMGYKKLNNELFFKYTFNIFPDDPFVLRRKNDIVTFEGRLNKQSEERFK